jgi:hypothetical protein
MTYGLHLVSLFSLRRTENYSCTTGFQSNSYSDTVTGASRVKRIVPPNGGAIFELVSFEPLPEHAVLGRSQHTRLRLVELARFLRSCVITASVHTFQFPPLPPSMDRETRTRTKFESLLKYDNKCAGCGTELTLPSEGTVAPSQVISVGMKDIRIGDTLSRLDFSDNRRYIYECFSALTGPGWGCWSESFVPFFFHFAQLYHPECKRRRGKAISLCT